MKIAAALGLLLAACGTQQSSQVLAVPTTGATYAPNDAAIRLLSQQRCTHEAQCGNVGPDAAFTTEAECTVATDLDERSAIGVDACPYGVAEARLRECLASIKAEPCSNPMRSLSRIPNCQHFLLCR